MHDLTTVFVVEGVVGTRGTWGVGHPSSRMYRGRLVVGGEMWVVEVREVVGSMAGRTQASE